MPVDQFKRIVLGTGLAGTDLGGGIIEFDATPVDPARKFFASEFRAMPGVVGSAGQYRVPFFAGASVTFTLTRASLHLEKIGSTGSTLLVEKSSTVDSFTPVLVATLTVASSSHDATDVTTSLGTIASGDLLRFRWTALGTGADSYYAQLEGAE